MKKIRKNNLVAEPWSTALKFDEKDFALSMKDFEEYMRTKKFKKSKIGKVLPGVFVRTVDDSSRDPRPRMMEMRETIAELREELDVVNVAFEVQKNRTCKNCKWRDENFYCNNDNICEDCSPHCFDPKNTNNSLLVYDYNEGGGFRTGDNFGCVHFEAGKYVALPEPELKQVEGMPLEIAKAALEVLHKNLKEGIKS